MSEAKHTPGPWHWRYEDAMKCWTLAPGILMLAGSDGTPQGDDIDQANARLIAAAPELLGALREALGSLEHLKQGGFTHGTWNSAEHVMDAARSAIAKATGEAIK